MIGFERLGGPSAPSWPAAARVTGVVAVPLASTMCNNSLTRLTPREREVPHWVAEGRTIVGVAVGSS